MPAEPAGVFASDVILIGVMLKDDKVGHRLNEADLPDLLLEPEKKQDAVIRISVHLLGKVPSQV